MYRDINSNKNIALVIFAHDESAIIRNTVRSAMEAVDKKDALFVIADNCTDETAAIARDAGAFVYARENRKYLGKGAALGWFVKFHWNILRNFRMLVVLDADSVIAPDFLSRIREKIKEGDQVMQCFVNPTGYEHSHISTLIALSELVEQSMFEHIREGLGWPVRLRGTGMVISPRILYSVADELQTEVEDIALTLLVAEKRIRVKRIDSVNVGDPKPTEPSSASRQRSRWFRGQWNALWTYREQILKIALQGIGGLSLLTSLFLKPRWLSLVLIISLFVLSIPHPFWLVIFGLFLLGNLAIILTGILKLPERKTFLKAIIFIPSFVFMWLKSIFLSFQRLPWLRVREVSFQSAAIEFKPSEILKSTKIAEIT
jgi:cellulose synthase/poly-beta-1,6-N-acetylglucosamine synthase-like glycosyltransferase